MPRAAASCSSNPHANIFSRDDPRANCTRHPGPIQYSSLACRLAGAQQNAEEAGGRQPSAGRRQVFCSAEPLAYAAEPAAPASVSLPHQACWLWVRAFSPCAAKAASHICPIPAYERFCPVCQIWGTGPRWLQMCSPTALLKSSFTSRCRPRLHNRV